MNKEKLEKIKHLLSYGDIQALDVNSFILTKPGAEKIINEYIKVSRVELPVMLRATEIKLYRPYYLGSDDGDYNGEDILFITEDKAWDYIHGQCCNICKEVNNGVGSQCESEWYVVEYDSCEST